MSWSSSSPTESGGLAEEIPAANESTDRHLVAMSVSAAIHRDGTWARPVRGSTRG